MAFGFGGGDGIIDVTSLNVGGTEVIDSSRGIKATGIDVDAGAATLVTVGTEDTNQGQINLHGDSSNSGCRVRMFNPGSGDTAVNSWEFDTDFGNMQLKGVGGTGGTTSVMLASATDRSVTFNPSGEDQDFIVEGDTDTDLIHADAATDRVGISIAEPAQTLDVGGNIGIGGTEVIDSSRHIQLRSYTVAGLPSAGTAGLMIYVSDETGGGIPAFDDGTNWRRVTDRGIVS